MANYNYLKYTSSERREKTMTIKGYRRAQRIRDINHKRCHFDLACFKRALVLSWKNIRIAQRTGDKREMLSINFKQLCSWKRSSGWGTLPINWWDTGSLVIRWLRYNDPALAVINWPFTRRDPPFCFDIYSAISSGLDKWSIVIDVTFKIYIIFIFNAMRCISRLYIIEVLRETAYFSQK